MRAGALHDPFIVQIQRLKPVRALFGAAKIPIVYNLTKLSRDFCARNSCREIPISRQLHQCLKAVKKISRSPYVVGSTGQPKEPRSYRDFFYRLLNRLGIPQIVFHGLRHTFASRCIESGCDCKTVSTILGHSNVATTLNLYVHPNINQKKKCVERMSRFLGITEL